MRGDVADMRSAMATKVDLAALKSEIYAEMRGQMNLLRADVTSDIVTLRKEVSDQIVGLRRAVVEYHSSVVGRSTLISDLEARVRRVEQHLNLPAIESY